ncbi:MAG: hypothetical protein HYZ47_01110 [Simkania negevensis]|nr:hypothetical protein [Simkania negevensis]
MLKGLKYEIQKQGLVLCSFFLLSLFGQEKIAGNEVSFIAAPTKQTIGIETWKEFHSAPGNCVVSLPNTPEHVKQVMPLANQGTPWYKDIRRSIFLSKLKRSFLKEEQSWREALFIYLLWNVKEEII